MINELPRSQASAADRGVTHREISWRAAMLRRALPALVPPRWLDPVLVLLVIGYLLGGIASTPYTLEEQVQQSLSADAGRLLTRPASLLPGGAVSPAQESVRLVHGALTRYEVAAGWYLSGGRAAQVPIDLTVPGPGPARTPGTERIVASRTGPAVLSVIGVLVMFVLARRLLGRAAGLAAVLLFGLHPTIALVSRQAADAGGTMALGLATILVAAGIAGRLAGGTDPGLGSWAGLSLLAGLTLASGPTAPGFLGGAVAFVLTGVIARWIHGRGELIDLAAGSDPGGPGRVRPGEVRGSPAGGSSTGWLAVTALGAVMIWVLVSPALWGWLPERLETRHQDRVTLVAEHLVADPGADDASARIGSGLGLFSNTFLAPPRPNQGVGLAGYRQSWWSGLPLGEQAATAAGPLGRVLPGSAVGVLSTVLGLVLTLAAGLGALQLWRRSRRQALAVFGWMLSIVVDLLLAPSDQADRTAGLVALSCLLAAGAVPFLLSYLARLSRQTREALDLRESPDSLDFRGAKDAGARRAARERP